MPDMWCDVDAALAEVPVNIMPLLDDTDFKSRETAVAYNAAGMDLVWNFVTPAGAYTQTAVTPTTSGTYDWAHQGDGMYSIEIPASGGASINNDTEGFGWFTGVATGVLPWRGPIIGFRASGLNDLLVESAYSTTRGLAGTALPNAAAEAAGGLYTRGSGAGQINQNANGQVDTNTTHWGGTAVASANVRADVRQYGGTNGTFASGRPEVNVSHFGGTAGTFASGRAEVNTTHIAGSAVSTSTAQIGVNVVNFGGSAGTFASGRPEVNASHIGGSAISQASGVANVNVTQISGDSGAADNLEAALDGTGGVTITAAVTGAITGNITGNLSGSVGSVTGNVGGNVAGSVGSLTTNNDKTGYRLSSTGVDDILDEVVEGSYTFRQFLRLFAAALGGELSGAATTTVVIRNASDSKTVITATVDADGNRSAMSLDLT